MTMMVPVGVTAIVLLLRDDRLEGVRATPVSILLLVALLPLMTLSMLRLRRGVVPLLVLVVGAGAMALAVFILLKLGRRAEAGDMPPMLSLLLLLEILMLKLRCGVLRLLLLVGAGEERYE